MKATNPTVVCPRCLSRSARERRSVTLLRRALGALGLRFYRCRHCYRRFVRF